MEVVDFKEIIKIKEEELEEIEIEVANQVLVAADQRGLEQTSQQKDFEKISR